MTGTIVNVIAIVAGSLIGVLLNERFPEHIQKTVMQGLSLAVVLIGLQMAMGVEGSTGVLIVIFSLVIGGVIGEVLKIEKRLDNFGKNLKKRVGNKNDLFVQGFVQASLIFCIGAMAIMGAIQDGLNNDPSILFTKSLLDGVASIAFAATSGIGVIFSIIPVLIYQGGISLLAAWAADIITEPVIVEMTATGGLLILAIGLNMLGASRIKIGNLLPSIFVAIFLSLIIIA